VSLRPKLTLPTEPGGVEGLRIAVSVDLGDWPVDDEVRDNTRDIAEALRELGAIVEEVDVLIPRADVHRATAAHFELGFAHWIIGHADDHADLMTPYAFELARWSSDTANGLTPFEKLQLEGRLYPPVGELLERFDAFICPTNTNRGLAAGDDYVGHGVEVGGQDVSFYFESFMTPVFNIMSRCPVLNVPSGFARNGVPTGIQIAGRTYDDETVFRVGAACEVVRPWLDVAERRPDQSVLVRA
jgi:Asp-tRNA(Asn)/Glu-tRNA(Gln) amidotransferase A subunit family amidase